MASHPVSTPKSYPGIKISGIQNNGFTLIEFLVAMGIMAIIFSFGLFFSMDMYNGYTFHAERDLAISVLQKARSQAISNICLGGSCTNGLSHGVHIETLNNCPDGTKNCYVIFQGSYTEAAPTNIYVQFVSTRVSHSGMSDVTFNQLDGGIASPPSAWPFTDGLHSSSISFNSEGRVFWTN